jgi:hypothetical protein
LSEDGDWEVRTPGQNALRETRRATAVKTIRRIDAVVVDRTGGFDAEYRDSMHNQSNVELFKFLGRKGKADGSEGGGPKEA